MGAFEVHQVLSVGRSFKQIGYGCLLASNRPTRLAYRNHKGFLMIRDPSDGTVKEEPSILKAPTSGLPATSTKLDYLERLEASREWLKTYHQSPAREAAT